MSELSWYQWESGDGRMVKVESKGTIEEAVCTVKDQITKFLMHVFIKRLQLKQSLRRYTEVVVVQSEFSQNYTEH